MQNYTDLIDALRCPDFGDVPCSHPDCKYYDPYACKARVVLTDAAAAIEALQAEVKELRRLNMELFDDLPKYGDKILHWVSVEDELPPPNKTVLVCKIWG